MSISCEHGLLRRQCALCDANQENSELRARIAELEAQHRAGVPDGFADVMRAVFREIEVREGLRGNAPGHGHGIPGVWDSDSGELAGKPCAWCALWNKAKAMLDAPAPKAQEHVPVDHETTVKIDAAVAAGRIVMPQPAAPDVTALVEALEQCITSMLDSGYRTNAVVIRAARHALAAHQKQGGEV